MRFEDRADEVLSAAGVLDRAPLDDAARPHDVDHAPVAQPRNREPRKRGHRLLVVERAREHVARLDEKCDAPLRLELAPVEAGVLDREGRTVPELLRENGVRVVVPAARLRPRERERAEHAAVRNERDRHRRAWVELRHELEMPVVERRLAQRIGRELEELHGSRVGERLRCRLARSGDRRIFAMERIEERLLGRVGRTDGNALQQPVVLDEVDDAPVGEARDDEGGKGRQRHVVLETLPEQASGLGEELQAPLRPVADDRSGDEVRDAAEKDDVVGHDGLRRDDREDAGEPVALAPDRGHRHRLRDG